jgi:GAF domain-containing protein
VGQKQDSPASNDRRNHVRLAGARLESLVMAGRAIVAELTLDTLLGLVAELARDVVGAEYAALALVERNGDLERTIYSGVNETMLAELRELAAGSGILSALVDGSASDNVRLRVLTESEPISGAASAEQALIRSFLAVAVRSSETLYGNLYLGNRIGAPAFTAEDEGLVKALAATAGIAIENARLHEESHRRQQWLRAAAEVTRHLIAGEQAAPVVLGSIADAVRQFSPADLVSVVIPVQEAPDLLEVVVAAGQQARQLKGMRYQIHDSLAWQAIQTGRGLKVANADQRKGVYLHTRAVIPVVHAMAVPLKGEAGVHGALVASRTDDPPFTEVDLELAETFATQATLALELAEARLDRHRLAVVEDRSRIARDLHDQVIQKLFAVGLTVQATARSISDPTVQQRLTGTITDIDDSIRRIRTAIVELGAETGLTHT